jgi:tetratricopeptide (TPR) repeat protein
MDEVVAQMIETTESFLQVEAIFNEAYAASEDARRELIENRCAGNPELEAEVWSLLDACLAEEQMAVSRQQEPGTGREAQPETRQIGPYLLDRLLGRGGMGAVYLAHRVDGQFEQKVAIKLIDLPLATAIFRNRFRRERQILAGLHHPYIARLLDGGVTSAGDLYLVMEYVDGVPIHNFCEEQKLNVPKRLTLFLRVCEAVQFAHQNFVVHRDLKPDNILVAEDGTPRLLDFGTAKLLSPSEAAPGSDLTREGYHTFTPQYASPEQVLGNPITTASDTYSLGVLLYLLLTGERPYELKELTTGEMLRVICEEPPRKPSLAAGSVKRLDPDLVAILEKSLRKEPQERYLTAEQLANDVRAFLEGHPVGARRGTLRYRSSKFAHRHWLALVGVAVLAVTLFAGIVGVLWQANVANEQRRKAEARSADLRQLSNSLLSELDEAIKELPGSTGAQKLLVTRVLEHLDRMAKDAQGDRQTQLDMVEAYTRLGNLQGNLYFQNLGDRSGGLESIDKAIALAAPLAQSGRDRDAMRALAIAQVSRSEILFGTARTQDAVVSMQAATSIYDRLIAVSDASVQLLGDVASAYGILGDELGQPGISSLGDSAGALKAYRKSIELDERTLRIDPNVLRAQRGLSIRQLKIGNIEMATDPALALKDYQAALQRADKLPKAEQENLAMLRLRTMLLLDEAKALVQMGEYFAADALFKEALQRFQHLSGADPQDMRSLSDLELVLNSEAEGFETAADPALATAGSDRRRNLVAAEKLLTEVVAVTDRAVKRDPSNEDWLESQADAEVRLGTIRSILHRADSFGELAKKGITSLKNFSRKEQASSAILEMTASDLLMVEPVSLRDSQFAVDCAERAVALSHRKTPSLLLTLARAYRANRQTEKSRATAQEALRLLPAPQPGSAKPRIRKLLELQL